MIRRTGRYFDGASSAVQPVDVIVDESGSLRISGGRVDRRVPLIDVRVSARLGALPRSLYLPGGAKCEVADDAAFNDAIERFARPRVESVVHRLERRWGWALAALVLTVALVFAGVEYGVPFAAERVARAVPPEIEDSLGRRALAALDGSLFTPTALHTAKQARVRGVFESMRAGMPGAERLNLELRGAPRIGANALALPAGIVVVTDALVELVDDDDELFAILAHEAGHVRHRHILRSLLQNSVTAILLATVIGDVSTIAGLSAALPTFLVEARYSRQFELEADRFAAAVLARHGRDPAVLGRALSRLAGDHGQDGGVMGYLSSHPATSERIEALEAL